MQMAIVVALALSSAMPTTADAGAMPERRSMLLVPKTDHEALRAEIYAAFPRAEGRWGAIHVVDRTCSVSRAVIAHLIERRASADVDELVIVIDREGASEREDIELVHAGFRVRVVARERASAVVTVAWPVMIVARPEGTLAYVGGHRDSHGTERGAMAGALSTTGGRVDPMESSTMMHAREALERAARARGGGFIDDVITKELVASGTTSLTAPVVGCAESR